MRQRNDQRSKGVSPLLVVLAGAAGCGSDPPPAEEVCEAGPAPVVRTQSAPISGFVRVRDLRDLTLDDGGAPRDTAVGRVQAGFADLSSVTSTPAAVMTLGAHCVGLVSRPVPQGARVPLDLSSLVVEGTGRGRIEVSRTSTGTFVSTGEPLLSSSPIRIVAEAAPSGGFPAFSEELAPIAPLEVTAPRLDGTGEITASGLSITWVPGNGDFIEVRVEPPPGEVTSGGQVVCQVADSGCFTMPAAATTFILSSGSLSYRMSIGRHRFRSLRPTAESRLDLSLSDEVELTLENGVFE